MKKIIFSVVIIGLISIYSCKKKDNSPPIEETTTTGSTTGSTPTTTVEGALVKFLNLMTDGNAKAWELVEYKDSLGNNLGGLGTKLVFAKATSSVFPDSKPNPTDTTLPHIIDNDNGYVILGTYAFAPNSNTASTGQYSAVKVSGIPSTFSQGGPSSFDSWNVVTSSTTEFKVSGFGVYNNKSIRKYIPSTIPAGFVPPAPTSTFCPVGTWTKTVVGCIGTATETINSNGTATLNDWTCDGTLNRIVTWTWTESNGYIDWHYTSYKVDGTDVLPLPADEHTSYTCSGNTFSSGGVTWYK